MTIRRTPTLRRPAAVLAALAFALVTMAGCGEDDDATATDTGSDPTTAAASPTESPTPSESATPTPTEEPAGPLCEEVWVDGAKLPGGYQTCYEADGKRVKANGRYCEFGKPLITYADSFWAVPGGPVHQVEAALLDDPDYAKALAQCSG